MVCDGAKSTCAMKVNTAAQAAYKACFLALAGHGVVNQGIVADDVEKTIDNLGDQLIGTQEGTTGWQYCTDDFGADHVQAFTSGAAAVQALVAGSVDCVVIDNEPAKAYVEANPGLTILDTEYAVEDYAIGVSKDNPALREAIDTALIELIEDGTVQTIVDKYITAD